MNKVTGILVSLVMVIIVIVTVYGLYSGGLDSIEEAVMSDDGSLADAAQNPQTSGSEEFSRTDTTAGKIREYPVGGVQNG